VEQSVRDLSNGYEAVAGSFMARRNSGIGVATVRAWARALRPGTSILNLGCGHGVPISQALIEDGFMVYGLDASASMIAAFHKRFPEAPVACGAVQDSRFCGSMFDGVVAWSLMFLLLATVGGRVEAAPELPPTTTFINYASKY
jgi:2-polyprenyl-3-methyl-5-hydroxy-6-metoxy-1,4-benzoquinol methylase